MPIKWERPRAERVVQQLYRDLFDREPERDVLRGLVGYLAEGRVSVRMQAMKMLKSEEFFDKRLRHKTPEDMARELYRFILAREPEFERSAPRCSRLRGKSRVACAGRRHDQQRGISRPVR